MSVFSSFVIIIIIIYIYKSFLDQTHKVQYQNKSKRTDQSELFMCRWKPSRDDLDQ